MIIPFSDQKTEAWERVSDLTKVTQLVSRKGVEGMDGHKDLTKALCLKNVIMCCISFILFKEMNWPGHWDVKKEDKREKNQTITTKKISTT